MYDLCEIFAGQAAVTRAFQEVKLGATTFEVRRNDMENIHTREGILILSRKLVHTKVKGLALCEPCCSSWIWVSLGGTLRSVVTRCDEFGIFEQGIFFVFCFRS